MVGSAADLSSHSSRCVTRRLVVCLVLIVAVSDLTFARVIHRIRAGCELIINGDWSDTQALILNENMTKIIHPESHDSVYLASTEKFVLACPGSQLVLKPEVEIVASCQRGTQVQVDEENFEFDSMSCEKLPQTSTRIVGKCFKRSRKGTNVEIGFNVETNFIKLIDICFDNRTLSTAYSHYVLTPKIVGTQRGFPRRQFQEGGFYRGVDISRLYTRKVQRKTIGDILGSKELGDKYILNDSLHFLARGHLTAKADFIYGSEQMGTFYYINVAPQWQIINAGNWASLEDSVRSYVAETGSEMSVYTIPYETAVLPDVNGINQKLYLYRAESWSDSENEDYYDDLPDYKSEDKREPLVPVPKFYIKILYHEHTKRGTAFITINNPYLEEITDDYILCEDICHQYPWLTWNQTSVKLGYSYCCPYHHLKGKVESLPELPIENLL